ncbi:peptidase C45 [Planctomicrobium sp. SH664]|uniref:peptidase C45 n=1 Tax=Planctomicrobium sp. SH664 TaxID=3448125 RepID=UPI003F5ADE62
MKLVDAAVRFTLLIACLLQSSRVGECCTTAVISGAATVDGRPLLWKNRDLPNAIHNEVVLIKGGTYQVLAVVTAGNPSSVWMGVNEAGMCIENSLSKDLGTGQKKNGPDNGEFMLLALKTCRNVAEVKALLEQTDATGRSTVGNFGVIDAEGGAVLFEAGPRSHVMFDANDPKVAPNGYLVRSNFSMTATELQDGPLPTQGAGKIYSGDRFLRARTLIAAVPERSIDSRYLLQQCSRDLADSEGQAFCGSVNGAEGPLPEFINTEHTISRSSTVSYAVFQGVRPGEDPRLTTMWVGLGDPKFATAVPCWVSLEKIASELKGKDAPLCEAAIALRQSYFSKERKGISTEGLQEIWNQVHPAESARIDSVNRQLERWRTEGVDVRSMTAVHLSEVDQALAALKAALKKREAVTVSIGAN